MRRPLGRTTATIRTVIVALGIGLLAPAVWGGVADDEQTIRATAEGLVSPDGTVCDVAVLPAGPRRPATIIASVAYSRRFCNGLVRTRMGTDAVILQTISAWQMESVSSSIVDVNGDGEHELLVRQGISGYEGARAPVATFTAVYRCDAQSCVDDSRRFPAFYERRLVELRRLIPISDPNWYPCRVMERDKILRILGRDRQAGLRSAEQWLRNADPVLRRRAVSVLADIDSHVSRRKLLELANGSDKAIAGMARIEIEAHKR